MMEKEKDNRKERKGNREIKSSLFTKLFEDNKSKIELYNALTGEDLSLDTEFFVIYTGEKPWDKEYLKLSDSFMTEPVENSMELVVKVIDIRYNKDEMNPILEKSEKLKGYSILLSYLKEAKDKGYDRTKSIDVAIDRCLKEGVLGDFLRRNSSEMGSFLYDSISVEEFIELRAEERAEEMAKERAEEMAEEHIKALAKTMKEKGYDVSEIAELTKLTKEQIDNL